ncbi:MAG: hypothetical protein JNM57_05550 [Cyclobacteriaceae bacterium]|nr:hypothetical protein [Cyclobacteriaceae bacterium]
MGQKKQPSINTEVQSVPEDQLIQDMMQKRKLQQEALIKIMTSIDKADEETTIVPKPVKMQKHLAPKKTFKIRKKTSK